MLEFVPEPRTGTEQRFVDEEKGVLRIFDLDELFVPNPRPDAVDSDETMAPEVRRPIVRPLLVRERLSRLIGNAGREEHRGPHFHEPFHQRFGRFPGKILGDLEAQHEIEPPVPAHSLVQVGLDEPLCRNLQLVYFRVAGIHSPNVVDPMLPKDAEPDSPSATDVADRLGLKQLHYQRDDEPRRVPLRLLTGVETLARVGAVRHAISLVAEP